MWRRAPHYAELADALDVTSEEAREVQRAAVEAAPIASCWLANDRRHDEIVRGHLQHFGGREIDRTGDGSLSAFDSPARAIRCAQAISAAMHSIGLEVRAGVHSGEVEVVGEHLGGIAVHIGARISALAGPDEVLVSQTVKEAVVGSGIAFDDRGTHELKGVPGQWQLHGVASN